MTIEDVLSPDTCVCRTDEGQVLEGESEGWLLGLPSSRRQMRRLSSVKTLAQAEAGSLGRIGFFCKAQHPLTDH